MDAFKNSVSIKYLEAQKKKKRKNTKPLDTLIETESDTDSRQTQDKPKTNLRQTQDKPTSHKLNTDLPQSSHTPPTDLPQTYHRLPTNTDTDLPQTYHRLTTNTDTDFPQTYHKNDDIPNLHNLSPMSMKIMQYIFDICVNSGNRITPRLRHKNIAEALNLNSNSIRNTIQRMIDDKFISRRINKKQDCRGPQYIINDFIYAKMMNFPQTYHRLPTNTDTNFPQTYHRLTTNTDTNTDTKSSSSSSININNITTTNIKREFENFFKNVTELNPSILSNSSNVRKCEISYIYKARPSITPEELVDSLENFCFDLAHGIHKKIEIPRSFFVSLMKESNYKSEVQTKKETEALKQQKIRKDKQNQELLEAQIALFPDEYDKALKSWINSLSNNDYKDLFGIEKDSPYFLNKDRMIEAKFHEIEWPNIFKSLNS